MKLTEQKAWRRKQLAALMEEFGQTKLAELTEISPAYLYQMAYGEGDSARGVSDDRVDTIETRIRRPGWFTPPEVKPNGSETGARFGKKTPGWTDKLSPKQLLASALVMDHLGHLSDKQADALIALMEAFAVGHKIPKSRQFSLQIGKDSQ